MSLYFRGLLWYLALGVRLCRNSDLKKSPTYGDFWYNFRGGGAGEIFTQRINNRGGQKRPITNVKLKLKKVFLGGYKRERDSNGTP